jgi:hypothetical protein
VVSLTQSIDSSHTLASTIADFGLLPDEGCLFVTWADRDLTQPILGAVIVAPGAGLPKHKRQLAEAHPTVRCTIRADRTPAPEPPAFHRATVKWAIQNADRIAIWSAPFPDLAEEFLQSGIAATSAGARFRLTIECNQENAAEWIAFVERLRRKATPVRVFGPVGAVAVAGFAS